MSSERNWYDKSYKWLLLFPALLLLISLVHTYSFLQIEGDIIRKDVSLTGGTTISVFDGSVDIVELKEVLRKEFEDVNIRGISDIRTGKQQGFFVESGVGVDELRGALENYLGYELDSGNSSIEFTGASLSAGFYQQLRKAIVFAFVFMAIVVFLIFRSGIPSLAVIFSAFADIVMTVWVVNILGMSISSAGIVAFLMLIGYSVDTDILLTSRVLKKKEGSINERIYGAFKTGVTMTLTSIIAVSVSLIIIYSFSEALRQIFSILLIGLGFDLINTWFANASIIKWYAEAKNL
jgi:preprotein translocase subunit SecF